jgi:nucleoside-diphosphate-sugar epimerase
LSAIGADATSAIPYARTKGLGEEMIRKEFNGHQSSRSLILRPSLVIGPDDQFLNVLHVHGWRSLLTFSALQC